MQFRAPQSSWISDLRSQDLRLSGPQISKSLVLTEETGRSFYGSGSAQAGKKVLSVGFSWHLHTKLPPNFFSCIVPKSQNNVLDALT